MGNGSNVGETLTYLGGMISLTLANHSCWSTSVRVQSVCLCPFLTWHFAELCPLVSLITSEALQGEVVAPPWGPAQSTALTGFVNTRLITRFLVSSVPLRDHLGPRQRFFQTSWLHYFFTSQGTQFHPGSSISPNLSPFCPPAPPHF